MIKPCAIYYRDHQAHAWKFERTSTPETANLVVNTRVSDSDPREYLVVPVPVLQQLYKGALPVHLDSTQTQGDFPGMVNAMRPSIDHGLLSPSGRWRDHRRDSTQKEGRMNNTTKLRILPAESELVKAEVDAISAMPLVGALTAAAFVAVDLAVMNGSNFICTCRSHTMARRIANALNRYSPGRKGY